MSTFSLYNGTPNETTSYLLGGSYSLGATYFDDVFDTLRDNKSKLISERDVRDAILSLASSFVFKETKATGAVNSYIGFDTLNINTNTSTQSYRDLSGRKIFLGKRSYSATASYDPSHDIFSQNSGLLNTDSDIFFYNTKDDQIATNYLTRLNILAGSATVSNLFPNAPYFQSEIVETGITDSVSLDFVNFSGDIRLTNVYGTISIHNYTNPTYSIVFPSVSESFASASTNKVLKWGDDKLYWDEIRFPDVPYLGATGSQLNIFGSEVYVNGNPMEFTDNRKVPISFNDVASSETFDHYPIVDLLRRIIYPYLPPAVSIKLLPPYESGYVEVGTFPTPTLQYTIQKRTENTQPALLVNMIPGTYPFINSTQYVSETSTSLGIVISPIDDSATIFTIAVSDSQNTVTATTSITGIYPYFYGHSTLPFMTNIGLGSLSKLVEPKSDKNINVLGTGSFYFIYDYDYGTLSNIYDGGGNTCSASFSTTNLYFSSPTGLWAGKRFYIYQWDYATQSPPSQNFQFKY